MTNQFDPLTLNPREFERLAQFIAEQSHLPIGGKIPQDLLQVPVVLPVSRFSENGAHIYFVDAQMLLSASQANQMAVYKPANTPYQLGSRANYKIAIAFEDIASISPELRDAGISLHTIVPFETLLMTCYQSDIGFALLAGERIIVMEPDRINEHVRSTFEAEHFIPDSQDISDISTHRLRPEEHLALLDLLDEFDWIAKHELYSAKVGNQVVNLLVFEAKPGFERSYVDAQSYELSRRASQIKSPFLIAGTTAPEPPSRGL